MSKKYVKSRIWATVGYPESLPADWLDQLSQLGLQIAISPLHDKDLDPTGEVKKPHYHIIFRFDGPCTKEHMQEICERFNMTIPIVLESLRGMYRYHLHLDNPEKYQYDDRDRILLGGFDVSSVEALTTTEVNKVLKELQHIIIDNQIYEYGELMDLLLFNDLSQMHDVALRHTMFLVAYINSKRHTHNVEKENAKKEMELSSDNI